MKKHYDVLIATIGTSLSNQYVESLMKTTEELSTQGISYKWLNGYGSLDHNTRESCLTGNGLNLCPTDRGPLGDKVTYNKIFWIGSNISWNVKDFLKLYNAPEDVIAGAYLTDTIYTSINELVTGFPIIKGKLIQLKSSGKKVEIASTKFGFLAVKSGVYERIDRPWHSVFPGCQTEEDSWCMKVRNANMNIILDPTVLVSNLIAEEIKWN
jgi:hypothetical protein